ncbi:MAG: hypothetical protein PWP11_1197 [Thauera sp.]|nr:hypothetical protein [Thauera sp.]MDI3489920.1 hypothetical protein [Thauera sp.]
MKVTQGSMAGSSAAVVADIFKGDLLKVSGRVYKLKQDVAQLKLISKDESRSGWTLLLIVLLAITIIGLILAIPLLMSYKKVQAIVAIKLTDGTAFVGMADKAEWATLSKYQTVDLPMGFELS